MSTFKHQLQQEAAKKELALRKEEELALACQTKSFLAFYAKRKEQILQHVGNEPRRDCCFNSYSNEPEYYHRCILQELQKEGLQVKAEQINGYEESWTKYTIPKTNWSTK